MLLLIILTVKIHMQNVNHYIDHILKEATVMG